MANISAQTDFTIDDPVQNLVASLDLTLLPENAGAMAMRELHYPGDTLAPLIYESNPEWWENFDTEPLTARSLFKAELTITDAALARWKGYLKDRPVVEHWVGDEQKSFMTLNMLRRLWEYYANPPDPLTQGYITWWPKDRTSKGYNIEIESLAVGGADTIKMNLYATRGGIVLQEVVLTFRIISEVSP
jgi:hypothetical protein